jgi:DNA-3-methyladenine glycosylase
VTHVPLTSEFFTGEPATCAAQLIGMEFRWRGCGGIIVETEAYAAVGDPACHTFFRKGARAFVRDQHPGTAYIYLNYGVHWLFNVLVKGGASDGFVLLRALEPTLGIRGMASRRPASPEPLLCAGPGRLTRALGIVGASHGADFLAAAPATGIFRAAGLQAPVLADRRIGISKGVDLPWRFLLAGSPALSRRPGPSSIMLIA